MREMEMNSKSFQVCGKEALEKTTLKSLGLNSGKAILRLIYRDHEQLKTQAHVSAPLLPKSVADNSSSDRDYQRVPSSTPHCSKTMNETVNLSTESILKVESQEKSRDEAKDTKDEKIDALNNKKQRCNEEKHTSKIEESHSIASSYEDHDDETGEHIAETYARVQENAYEIKFVRCNCAYVQSHSSDGFTYRGISCYR